MCIELMYKTNSPKSEILSWGQIFRQILSWSWEGFILSHMKRTASSPLKIGQIPKGKFSSSNSWFSGAMLDMRVSGRVEHFDASKTSNHHLIVLSIVCVITQWSSMNMRNEVIQNSYNMGKLCIYTHIYNIYTHPTFKNTSTLSVSKKAMVHRLRWWPQQWMARRDAQHKGRRVVASQLRNQNSPEKLATFVSVCFSYPPTPKLSESEQPTIHTTSLLTP